MKQVIIILLFSIISFSASAGNLYRSQNSDRILNGVEVDGVRKKTPWIFSLRKNGTHICGASFIAPEISNGKITKWSSEAKVAEWAITAAHCVVNTRGKVENPKIFTVSGGALKMFGPIKGVEQTVREIILPNVDDSIGSYNRDTSENDIALLRLNATGEQHEGGFHSIKLPNLHEASLLYRDYTALYTAGWGRTSNGGPASTTLLEVRLPLVNKDYCKSKYEPIGGGIYPGMICAGYVSGEYDSCQGDSGGPLFFRPSELSGFSIGRSPVLVGVVSWGQGCGGVDYFGIYTNVAYYERWIRQSIESRQQN